MIHSLLGRGRTLSRPRLLKWSLMKRSDDKPLNCRYCEKDIVAGELAIRTAAGPMHKACSDENAAEVTRMLSEAIAQGTHSERSAHFCGGGRRLVASIYHGGFGGTRMCPDCADSHAGAGPKS